MLRRNVEKLQRSQYRPSPGQSASVTYFVTALTADCRTFVIIRFKCKSTNLPVAIVRIVSYLYEALRRVSPVQKWNFQRPRKT